MGLYSGGLITGGIFASEIMGGGGESVFSGGLSFFGGEGGLLWEFYGICKYLLVQNKLSRHQSDLKPPVYNLPVIFCDPAI